MPYPVVAELWDLCPPPPLSACFNLRLKTQIFILPLSSNAWGPPGEERGGCFQALLPSWTLEEGGFIKSKAILLGECLKLLPETHRYKGVQRALYTWSLGSGLVRLRCPPVGAQHRIVIATAGQPFHSTDRLKSEFKAGVLFPDFSHPPSEHLSCSLGQRQAWVKPAAQL